ncbi:unnamed protein product [Paramecium sonneborni]|uniref:Uncharacterized protein n=1 Tax=Paramecium sonneborni TaxID=65129 RepID=A0A8S1NAY8_9CILI|nr:unnamed protein product [Paramecium sonneborni]
MKIFIFALVILCTSQVSFKSVGYCGCEYAKNEDLCKEFRRLDYCEWNQGKCIHLSYEQMCAQLTTKTDCEELEFHLDFDNGIRCTWSDNKCITKKITCETSKSCIDDVMGCYRNAFKKCTAPTTTTCSDYRYGILEGDHTQCPSQCMKSNSTNICEEYNCKKLTTQKECEKVSGYELSDERYFYCNWSIDGSCDLIETGLECSKYNKYEKVCKASGYCIYEDNQCQIQKCSDQISIETCTTIGNIFSTTLCTWKNGYCYESTEEEFQQQCKEQQYSFFRFLFFLNEKGECQRYKQHR